MRRYTILIVVLLLAVVVGRGSVDAPDPGTAGEHAVYANLGNPAAVYCADMGNEYETVDDKAGQTGVCRMPDGEVCEAWDFLAGKCGQRYSYCAQQGYDVRMVSDGKDPFSSEYAVCVTGKGSVIGSVTELSALTERATGCGGEFPAGERPPASGKAEEYVPPPLGAPPASFDWRSYQSSNWMTSIKSQGICGSCWAFSAVGVAEAAHNIANNDPDLDKNLSEQYLVSDCYDLYGQSCCGGWQDLALTYIRDSGIPDEGCMSYVDGSGCSCDYGTCDSNCTYSSWNSCSDRTCSNRCGDWAGRLEHIVSTGAVSSDRQTIKQALVDTGPLAVAIGIGDSYGGYWDGDVYRCGDDSGANHAVAIVGYDDSGSYWWVRNSWGTGWGESGYFKLGYGECYIEQDVYYANAGSSSGVGPLIYGGHTVDDDTNGESNGDDDGVVECGEAIELYVDLYNQGGDTATGVNATISTDDPYVTFTHNTDSDYPDVTGGGSGTNTDDFDFEVDPDTPNGHDVHFDLDVTASNGGPWSDSFDVSVTCGSSPCNDPHEPNDDAGQATPIGYGTTLSDPDICLAGDVDYYAFSGSAGDVITADIDARAIGSSLDPYLYLYDTDSVTELEHNDDYDGLDSYLVHTLPADGTYYLMVREYSHGSEGGPDYFYTISLTGSVDGLSVEVVNQSDQPAVDAYVQVYSNTAQWPDVTGYTDGSGGISFPDVPPGTYTVVVTSGDDHFLLIEENVTAPASLSLDTDGTAQVDVYTYGLDGATPVGAGILFAPFFTARPDVGWTDANGHLQVNVTPHTYSIIAASFDEPYLLVKPNVVVGGAMQVDFDPPQMPRGEVSFDLLDFSSVRVGSWGSYSAWSWNFELDDGQTMTFSPDTYSMGPDLIKAGTQATWYYAFDGGYASYDVVAGASETVRAGGSFAPCTMPDGSFYGAGESVSVDNCLEDAFGNQITRIETYTPDAAGGEGPITETTLLRGGRRTIGGDPTRGKAQAVSGWADVCPTMTISDPGDQAIVDQNTCSIWGEAYQLDLSAGATAGLYDVDLSVDTGPHQGVVEGAGHFAVGWIFGDLDGDCWVGALDFQHVADRWRASCADPGSGTPSYDAFYDIDKDGEITMIDVMQVVPHWGEICP